MHWSSTSLNRIASSVRDLKRKCSEAAEIVTKGEAAKGEPVVFDIKPIEPIGKIAAVDSGFSVKQFVSIDVMILRAVGCVFTYANGEIASTSFYPGRAPGVTVHYGLFSEQGESTLFRSLTRLNAELACALQIVNSESPELLLIDGSLLPLPGDKPPAGSELQVAYSDTLELYERLFAACMEKKVQLAGVVKDPRSQRLCTLLSRDYPLPTSSDAFFTDLLLSSGQISKVFTYADNVGDSPVLRDLGKWPSKVRAFYLKAGTDLPYRVEFIAGEFPQVEAAALACKLAGLGSQHAFAYPAVLIEADMRAALTPQEINSVFTSLSSRTFEFTELRANSRPFR